MHALTFTTTLLLASGLAAAQQQRTSLDFSQAEEDPSTGELCITQRVCLANPAALERLVQPHL